MIVIVLEKVPEDPEIILAWNSLMFRIERPEIFFTRQRILAANLDFSHDLALARWAPCVPSEDR